MPRTASETYANKTYDLALFLIKSSNQNLASLLLEFIEKQHLTDELVHFLQGKADFVAQHKRLHRVLSAQQDFPARRPDPQDLKGFPTPNSWQDVVSKTNPAPKPRTDYVVRGKFRVRIGSEPQDVWYRADTPEMSAYWALHRDQATEFTFDDACAIQDQWRFKTHSNITDVVID